MTTIITRADIFWAAFTVSLAFIELILAWLDERRSHRTGPMLPA